MTISVLFAGIRRGGAQTLESRKRRASVESTYMNKVDRLKTKNILHNRTCANHSKCLNWLFRFLPFKIFAKMNL